MTDEAKPTVADAIGAAVKYARTIERLTAVIDAIGYVRARTTDVQEIEPELVFELSPVWQALTASIDAVQEAVRFCTTKLEVIAEQAYPPDPETPS